MTQQEGFELFVRQMEALGIPYMIAGSVAAMAYGEPRLTKDLDVVLAMLPDKAAEFCRTMTAAGFYCPPVEVIQEEFRRRGQFNLLHLEADAKIDCIFLGQDDYSVTEFRRRERTGFTEQMQATLAKPEDVILSKLRYFRMGGSEKHLTDIRGMLRVSGEEIDLGYVGRWVRELGLEKEWEKAKPE